ncbi:MAG: hypothetical protein R2800_01980 [Flavipsychrobacter sp.]
MQRSLLFAFLFSFLFIANGCAQGDIDKYPLPKGWYKAGSVPSKYAMGVADSAGRQGGNAATIQSIKKRITGFGTLMQTSMPDSFLGRRVRMTGYMRSVEVKGWAGFWLRVDKNDGSRGHSAFDNMYDRRVVGTTDWNKYEIVLDINENTKQLAYGALLDGTGQIWFDDIEFEIVDETVATTGSRNKVSNTDFEE